MEYKNSIVVFFTKIHGTIYMRDVSEICNKNSYLDYKINKYERAINIEMHRLAN